MTTTTLILNKPGRNPLVLENMPGRITSVRVQKVWPFASREGAQVTVTDSDDLRVIEVS